MAQLLTKSDLFRNYREAFRMTTGLGISLQPSGSASTMPEENLPFVTRLRLPVIAGQREVVTICVQPVRVTSGEFGSFEDVARRMLDDGDSASAIRRARDLYASIPTISEERHNAMSMLLRCFTSQLGDLAEKLFLQMTDCEPNPVRKARQFILGHLSEPLSLEDVSRHAGVSPFHFCKLFKRATGLTFTTFVNKARVERAKELLLKPQSRVTEVAYDVGFQSLSQFNRSFRRVTLQSPTEYRSNMKPGYGSLSTGLAMRRSQLIA